MFDLTSARLQSWRFSRSIPIISGKMDLYLYTCKLLLIGILIGCKAMALSFSGPEVLKLDWNTRSLNVSDMNNDGLNDLILINNDTAKIEILYQLSEGEAVESQKQQLNRNRWEPVLEDARFESEAVTIGFPLFDLTVGCRW